MSTIEEKLHKLLDEIQDDDEIPFSVDYWNTDNPNPLYWQLFLIGPEGSPYSGGRFKIKVTFPKDYPSHKPSFNFFTKIYHNDVSESDGSVCINLDNTTDIKDYMNSLFIMFEIQNPHGDAKGNLYKNNRSEFNRIAGEWTAKYATIEQFDSVCPVSFPK